jgi:hypothetical protein
MKSLTTAMKSLRILMKLSRRFTAKGLNKNAVVSHYQKGEGGETNGGGGVPEAPLCTDFYRWYRRRSLE